MLGAMLAAVLPTRTSQDTLDLGEMVIVCLAPSLFWLLGKLDPGSSDKCVFAALLNDVCGVW